MTRLALVGCGGRGTGAVGDALSTTGGPVQLYAMADLFGDRLQSSLKTLSIAFKDKIDVTSERCFLGFDAYKKAIDCLSPGDVVLLTTHAAFRPMMFEYAVKKGVNVFMEKSFAPDAPNTRRLLAAAAESERKNHSHADDPRFDPGGQAGELNRVVERNSFRSLCFPRTARIPRSRRRGACLPLTVIAFRVGMTTRHATTRPLRPHSAQD